MHIGTKLTPILRKEVYQRWKKEKLSHRALASLYHVDKRVIGRIIERGEKGDFSLHTSTNKKYLKVRKKSVSKKKSIK